MIRGTDEITNSQDVIDSRDVIARISELESQRDDAFEASGNTWDAEESARNGMTREEFQEDHWWSHDPAEAEELAALQTLQEEAQGYAPDWNYGATLIRESYFVEYCEQLVSDIGDMPRDIPGYIVINWEATANNLKADYTTVDFDGVDYLVR